MTFEPPRKGAEAPKAIKKITNANRAVNGSDVSQVKAQMNRGVDGGNFREDVNVDGAIDSADVALVKSRTGNSVP